MHGIVHTPANAGLTGIDPSIRREPPIQPFPVASPGSVVLSIQDHAQAISALALASSAKDSHVISGNLLEAIRATERSLDRLRALHIKILSEVSTPAAPGCTTPA